jgi:hypothetical protein
MRFHSAAEIFDPERLAKQVPPAGLRYLRHAIRPGATLARRAEITFHGFVRLKPRFPWLSFRGQETIEAGQSFHVRALASLGPLPVTLHERYERGMATAQLRLFGFLPVMSRHSPDLARSTRGRFIVESTWLPSSFLPEWGASWSEEGDLVQLTMPIENEEVKVTMRLESDGLLRELRLQRWSDLTDEGKYGWVPFAAHTEEERTFGDYTVPSRLHASWWPGTDCEFEFFRAVVDTIHYSS